MQKSHIEVGVDEPSDEVAAQREALALVAVGFFEDAPHLERANHMLYSDAKASEGSVMLFIFVTEFFALRFFDRQAALWVS